MNMDFYKQIIQISFLLACLFLSPFSFSSSEASQSKCIGNFISKDQKEVQKELPLTQPEPDKQPSLFIKEQVKGGVLEELLKLKETQKLTKKQMTEPAAMAFIQLIANRLWRKSVSLNITALQDLVKTYPAITNVRITDQEFLKKHVNRKHLHWCPEGWSVLQLVTYHKSPDILEFIFKLGFKNVRTKKKNWGAPNMEHNPLHISIKRNWSEGVSFFFTYAKYVMTAKERQAFINEKNQDQMTPWALAVEHDRYEDPVKARMVHRVGRQNPSGFALSYYYGSVFDGFEIAKYSGNEEIIRLANMYLVAHHYQEKTEQYGERNKKKFKRPDYASSFQ